MRVELILILIVTGLIPCKSWPNQYLSKDFTFDYFLFVQQWAPAFCYSIRETCKSAGATPRWTMHGLWPTSNGSEGPNDCGGAKFNIDTINSIEKQMMYYWPELIESHPYAWLWQHEWTKHGTCAVSVPQVSGEFEYFNGTLAKRAAMDYYNVLNTFDIKPSKEYTYNDTEIRAALYKGFGAEPMLECNKYDDGNYILVQISFCLDKTNLNVFQCEEFVYKHDTCRDTTIVYLPFTS